MSDDHDKIDRYEFMGQKEHDLNLSLLAIIYSDLLSEFETVAGKLDELRTYNDNDEIGYVTDQLISLNAQVKTALAEMRRVRAKAAIIPGDQVRLDYAKLLHEVNNGLNFINNSMNTFVFAFDRFEESRSDNGMPAKIGLGDILPIPAEKLCDNIRFGLALVKKILAPVDEDDSKSWMRSKPVSLNEEISAIIDLIEPLCHGRIHLIKQYEKLPPVICDLHKIHQVLLNLAINAVQAMEQGGEICFSTYYANEKVHISVEDNGVGIAPHVFAKIEQPFFTTKKAEQGMGLGLKISFAIIRHHNGTMVVESKEGKGTKVTISLPLAPQEVSA